MEFEWAVIIGLIGISYTLFGLGSRLERVAETLDDTNKEIRKLTSDRSSNERTFNMHTIYDAITQLPEKTSEESTRKLGYIIREHGDLKDDLHDLKRSLKSIDKGIQGLDTRLFHLLKKNKLS